MVSYSFWSERVDSSEQFLQLLSKVLSFLKMFKTKRLTVPNFAILVAIYT